MLPVALASGVIGAGLVVGAGALFDIGGADRTTTVVQQAPLATADASQKNGGPLTARDIYKRDAPGVAFITAQIVQRTSSPFDFGIPQEQQGTATGSGFVVDKDGTIAHERARRRGRDEGHRALRRTARRITAEVMGVDKSTDLAVLKIDPTGVDLQPLPLGDSSHGLQVGDPAIAIGNPFGLDRTLTTGIVSGAAAPDQGAERLHDRQRDPDRRGDQPRQLGRPAARRDRPRHRHQLPDRDRSGGNGNVGIGFAVPINTVKQKLHDAEDRGHRSARLPRRELQTVDASLAGLLPVDSGALVQTVTPGSPAAKAGLNGGDITRAGRRHGGRPGGDLIIGVDGRDVKTEDALASIVAALKPGDKVKIEFFRARNDQDRRRSRSPSARPRSGRGQSRPGAVAGRGVCALSGLTHVLWMRA